MLNTIKSLPRNKRRHSTGFGYIGFGNNQSVFNQSANKAFSNLKDKLNRETHAIHKVDFLHKKLSKADKEAIKTKIRTQKKLKTKKTITAFVIMAIPVFLFIKYLIDKLAANL